MKLYPNVSAIFVIWALSVFTIFFFGFSNFPHSGKFSNNFWENLKNWDGGHYIAVAEAGYKEEFQYAFFPLYPLSIRFINHFIQNYTLSAVLISVVSLLIAINLFYSLMSLDFSRKLAQTAIFWLLLFPTSFYFLTAYSEGLFFLLVVATFYFARRGNLMLATILVSLASATRLAGLALSLAFLVEVQTTRGISRKNWYVLGAPLGFVIFCWYLWTQTQDPFYFISAQTNWQRSITITGLSFWETVKSLTQPYFIAQNFNVFLDLVFAIFGLGMVLRSFRFLPISYAVYGFFSILLPLLTPTLSSVPRFLLPIFPIFILIALIKNQYVVYAYQLVSVMLLSAFAILFINGYWVS